MCLYYYYLLYQNIPIQVKLKILRFRVTSHVFICILYFKCFSLVLFVDNKTY